MKSCVWLVGLVVVTSACGGKAPEEESRIASSAQAMTAAHTATAVSVGALHSCALLDNSMLKCWGANWTGQLGQGDTVQRGDQAGELGNTLNYVFLSSEATVTSFASGREQVCALLDTGVVKCWGNNSYGQLGQGNTIWRGDNAGEMEDALGSVDFGPGRTAKAIAAGNYHTCAILDNNQLKCWGQNTYGQLGLGNTAHRGDGANEMGSNLPAVGLGTGRTAKAVSAGFSHTCAILDNNQLKCWGGNGTGQLGLGDQSHRGDAANEMGDFLPAINLGTGRTAKVVNAGYQQTCAILDNNVLKCWGMNANGQLGLGDTLWRGDNAGEMGDFLSAVNLGTSFTPKGVAGGRTHTCAVATSGSVKCWGNSSVGQLGLGDTVQRGDGPNEMGPNLPVVNLGTSLGASSLSTLWETTCGQVGTGVKCWGQNTYGQLGVGSTAHKGDNAGEMGDSLSPVDLGVGQLASKFLKSHVRAIKLMQGQTYNVNDPNWVLPSGDFNKAVFAYKLLSAFHMLGYNTEIGFYVYPGNDPHSRLLHKFQQQYGFTVEDTVRSNVLAKLDDLLYGVQSGQALRALFYFSQYNKMQPMARNDASKDYVGMLFGWTMQVLPSSLRMLPAESLQCLAGQCYGFIVDATGADLLPPVDPTSDYRFVSFYHSPFHQISFQPPGSVHVHSNYHEYAHYLDRKVFPQQPGAPHQGLIDTTAFGNIGFDMSQAIPESYCAPHRSSDIHDFISAYGFDAGYCPAGTAPFVEDFADSFGFYVTAGRKFRTAAAQRPMLAARYNWLRDNVFAGIQFDTDLTGDIASGCNDAPGLEGRQPAWISCNEDAIWNGNLPTLP